MNHRIKFKDFSFLVSTCSLVDPFHALHSFTNERDIREDWWKINPGDIVIDVGAAQGSYTLPALAMGAGGVVSIEPGRDEYFDLCSNLLANGWLSNRCIPINSMAGEYEIAARVYKPRIPHPLCPVEWRQVITLDSFVESSHLPKLDWIKIDVEGDEERVLLGSLKIISHFLPKILVEIHEGYVPGIGSRVEGMIHGLGYSSEKTVKPEDVNGIWVLFTPLKEKVND